MTLLSHILKWLLFIVFALGLLIVILDYTNLSFKSEKARQVLLENIKTVTGRNASIDGDIYLTVSLSPKLLVEQIHIKNINGFDSKDFITITEARVEVFLLPLLSGTFHLEEIAAKQVKINLFEKKDGSHNWPFDHVIETKADETKVGLKKQRRIKRFSLGRFNLTDVSILYKNESSDHIIKKHFERLMIDVMDPAKPYAEISGSIQGLPYNLDFKSDSIQSLISGQPWLLHGEGKIAGSKTSIEANLQLIKNTINSNIDVNAVSLNNADIKNPGGKITASASFEVVDNEITGNTELNINKFDYGIAARILDPAAKLDGLISIRAELEVNGSDFTHLLNNATGQIDFAVWPKDTRPAKMLDLWATNLYLILLPELKKKESKINCLIGLMNIENGKMKEEFFAIDTSKLWISGNFNVDFKQEHVELSLFPRSKKARLFALETPIRASGKFSDIDMVINPVDLTGSYILFITSPLHVPTRWIFDGKPPEDGSAVCEQFFDREYVENLNKELRKKEQEEIDEILNSDY